MPITKTETRTLYDVELHWLTGDVDKGQSWGTSRENATVNFLNQCGYGQGALGALDYWNAREATENGEGQ